MSFNRISIIGTGNIAGYLAHKISTKGYKISHIYGRDFNKANIIAEKSGAKAVKEIHEVTADTDLLIVAVKDDAISDIASKLGKIHFPIVHTSGMETPDVLKGVSEYHGKLYPLQSITIYTDMNVEVPVCVFGSDKSFENKLAAFSKEVFGNSFLTKAEDFPLLHLSAVIVNNFTNALFTEAFDLLNKIQIDPKVLFPLIQETFRRIELYNPVDVQTGPAVRSDVKTMQKHVDLLSEYGNSDKVKIYELMSKLIQSQKKK